jgi:hypothetical protein
MKKITLLILSTLALASTALGQTSVNAAEFTSNPDKFKGVTISIDGVILHPNLPTSNLPSGSPAGAPRGAGLTSPGSNVVANCNTPHGYRAIDVDFPSNPAFAKCFYMSEAQYNSLPHTKDVIKAQIIFKGDQKFGYIITLFKLK